MSNKRPNQNKRDKKPALSSANDKSQKKAPARSADKSPDKSAADAKAASKSKVGSKPATSAAADQPAAQPASQAAASNAAPAKTEQKPVSAGTPRLSSTAPAAASGSGDGGGNSRGWIAPLALLFGLIGTAFSAYIYTQLNALRDSTAVQLQNQAADTKTNVATVQTDLDAKSTALTAALDEKTGVLSTALEDKTSLLETALEEKSSALTTAIEQKNTELSSALTTTIDQKSTELSSALEESSSTLLGKIESSTEALQADAQKNTSDIATSTAAVVQELTSKTELEINNISTSFNTGLALMRERNSKKFSQLDKQMTELDTSVQTTNELAMRGQRDWVLAEVNYLLRTGVHRVKLAGDMKAGVIALESASDRLHTLGDIDYLPVREQIAEEVAALRRVGPPDIEGLIFKLQHMSKRADSLPLPPSGIQKTRKALEEDPASAGVAIGQSLLDKFRGSIKIVPSDGAAESARRGKKIKPTKEQLTASDSLRLHLQAARLSALRHDSANFTEHMDNAINYSTEIFDQEDAQVETYINDLNSIRETSIVPKTPMLGSSLSLFNKIDSKRGNN